MSSTDNITLYLGNELTIHGTDISFNNADVFVKQPTTDYQIANKKYVDDAKQLLSQIIADQSAVNTSAYNDLLQLIDDLSTQVDNLYMYFFNEHRGDIVPTRT